MGVLYNGNYLRFFEAGRTNLLNEMNLSYQDVRNAGIELPIARVKLEYKKPIYYGENFELHTRLKYVDGYKFIIEYIFKNEKGILAKGETVQTAVDIKTGKLVPLPSFLKEVFDEWVG